MVFFIDLEVKKLFNLANGPIKIAEKTIKTLSWNYKFLGNVTYALHNIVSYIMTNL